MRNVFVVACREILQQIRSRSFIFATIGMPIFLMGIWAMTGALDSRRERPSVIEELARASRPDLPVGYVDRANLLQSIPVGIPQGLFVAFPDEAAADAAVSEKRVGAYYVLPPDYLVTGEVKRISPSLPLVSVDRPFFEWVIEWNLFPGRSVEEIARLHQPFGQRRLEFVPVGDEELSTDSQKSPGFAPFFLAMLVTLPLFMAGGYLLQGLAQEKENRVIEMLLVSLRPWQLLAGKLLGLGTLTIVQFSAWLIIGSLTVKATGRDPVDLLSSVDISGVEPVLVAAFAIGGFLLYATLMAGLGAVAPNVEATRMWAFLIGSPMMLPIFLWTPITSAPSGPLAVTLSILPFSSPVGMVMRLMATSVAEWEVALSLMLLGVASVAMLLLMSRLFRAGTLLSGQPLSASAFWKAMQKG